MNHDIEIRNEGSVVMFAVLTQAARDWVAEHIYLEDWQWLGNAFAVEPRYADDLESGMSGDGLVVL